jgi:hypothetical protein
LAQDGGTHILDPISVGDPFTYGIVVDSSLPDLRPDDIYLSKYAPITAIYLEINGTRFLEANGGEILLINNEPSSYYGTVSDVLQASVPNSSLFTTNLFSDPAASSQINLKQVLTAGEPTLLDSNALPLHPLNPALSNRDHSFHVYLNPIPVYFNETTIIIDYINPYFSGNITGMNVSSAVPEPATIVMTGIGVCALALFRKSRSRILKKKMEPVK